MLFRSQIFRVFPVWVITRCLPSADLGLHHVWDFTLAHLNECSLCVIRVKAVWCDLLCNRMGEMAQEAQGSAVKMQRFIHSVSFIPKSAQPFGLNFLAPVTSAS